jgi:TolB-like protein
MAAMLLVLAVPLGVMIWKNESERSVASNPAPPEKSIAVLPFGNQNRDPDAEYLCDGIPESIINSLSQLPNLKVMSRNSVFHYKGKDMDAPTIAKELKVQAVQPSVEYDAVGR